MEYSRDPPNTFRPIQDQPGITGSLSQGDNVTAPGYTNIHPHVHPLCTGTNQVVSPHQNPKLENAWRQGSENWSSTGSRQSSRPGSANQSNSRPPSNNLYSKTNNGSTPDVNFQQLSVNNRRAAFRTQKWSNSFDQTCLAPSPGVVRRRQASHQQVSLDLDSGYPGSPASGFASYQSQTWTDNPNFGVTSPVSYQAALEQEILRNQGFPKIQTAKKELAGLIKDQQNVDFSRTLSLPSFPESFQTSPLQNQMLISSPKISFEEHFAAQEEQDALDDEIKEIVEQAKEFQTFGVDKLHQKGLLSQAQSQYTLIRSPNNQESRYFKPRPIRTSTITFSPTGEISSIDQSSLVTHSGGRVSLVSESHDGGTMNTSAGNKTQPVNQKLFTKSESVEVNEKEDKDKVNYNIPIISSESLCVQKDKQPLVIPESGMVTKPTGHIMVAVVSAATHTYDGQTNVIEGKMKLLTDTSNLKQSNSEDIVDNSQSPTPYYSSSISTTNKLKSPTLNLFRPVSSPMAPSSDSLLVEEDEPRVSNLQTYTYQDSALQLQQPAGFKRTAQFTSKVVDLPRPKPFQVSQSTAETNSQICPKVEIEDNSLNEKMLLESEFDSYHVPEYYNYNMGSLPSPISNHPSPSITSPSTNTFFQFPPAPFTDCSTLIKHEPSQWKVPSIDLPSTLSSVDTPFFTTTTTPTSPMILSPAVSNLNTPRVSLSSHGGSDLGLKIRSSHSSIHSHSSNNASPVAFSSQVGTFGHSMAMFNDFNQNINMDISSPQVGYNTTPGSGFSSPSQDQLDFFRPAPPSYEQSIQQNYKMEPLSSLPPPYPFSQLKSDASPSAPQTTTPDPDSILSECGRDTPDSSIKEEPSEDASEGGNLTCKWKSCGREYNEKQALVDHINSNHIEHKKGCEEFPCFWESCPRRWKPFNAKYKLLTHMRVHTGEKPYSCKQDGCQRSFARLENLKIHNRSHTGEKPFLCKYQCSKAFSNSSDRAKHEQTHKDPKPYKCEVFGCQKRYTDPSSLRKHVKNHTKEEQDQLKLVRDNSQGKSTDTSQEGWLEPEHDILPGNLTLLSGGGVMAQGMYEYGARYENQCRKQVDDNQRLQQQQVEQEQIKRGPMVHQPNSLDSLDGEAPLPFDPVPIRFDTENIGAEAMLIRTEDSKTSHQFH